MIIFFVKKTTAISVAIIVTTIMTRVLQNDREIPSTLRRRRPWSCELISFHADMLCFFFIHGMMFHFGIKRFEQGLHISKHSQNPGSQKRNDRAIVAQRIVTPPPAIWCQGCWYFYNLSFIKITIKAISKCIKTWQSCHLSNIQRWRDLPSPEIFLCSQHVTRGFKRCTSTESFYN